MDSRDFVPCRCLCPVHVHLGECTGAAETSLWFDSKLTGQVAVPMCSVCAVAVMWALQKEMPVHDSHWVHHYG